MKPFLFGLALLFLVVLGGGVFVWQILAPDPERAWEVFLTNLLFFSAVAQSGPVLVAIYHLTEARWGHQLVPLAIGLGAFLPFSFVLFIVLLFAFPYFPTYSAEYPARHIWFDPLFLTGRHILGIAILYSVSLAFSYQFLNSMPHGNSGSSHSSRAAGPLSSNRRIERDRRTDRTLTSLAVLVLAMYALVFSLIGFDLVMALDRQWYSTLFGGYFFVSSFYIGLAAIIVTAYFFRNPKIPQPAQVRIFWDLGKLVFAFCLLTAYFFWAQYLVIWYGNLPEEIGFFMRRLQDPSWAWLTWVAIGLTFSLPFLALLSRRVKQSSWFLCCIAVVILVGMWLERYLLVAPSVGARPAPVFGWTEAAITMSFVAAVVYSYSVYLQRYRFRFTL